MLTPEQNKKIQILFTKHKKFLKSYKSLAQFKEPIAFLIRRSNNVEFYEGVRGNEFEFDHSDGNTRSIILNPAQQKSFDYGDRVFRGYILHEDTPVPLPTNPTITTGMMAVLIDKVLSDLKKWKAAEWLARGKMLWYLLGGIALIIVAYALYTMFKTPTPVAPIIQNTTEIAKHVINTTGAAIIQ